MESFVAATAGHWKVVGLPAFQDNYLWLIINTNNNHCVVIDPGCADTVGRYLASHELHLSAILLTHHHPDHIGGVSSLLAESQADSLAIYGTASGRIQAVTNPVTDNTNFTWESLTFSVLELPGHTIDHVAYVCRLGDTTWLFCGDTLFVGGCGRLFEGSHEQMHQSLQKLASLPASTLVFCAHEYSESNYKFLASYQPSNSTVLQRYDEIMQMRKSGLPTVPSTLEKELQSNLFIRAAGVDEFKAIRQAKDNF